MVPQRAVAINCQVRGCVGVPDVVMLLHMIRTTLIIDEGLMTRLRRHAADERRTLTEIVERALRMGLEAMASGRRGRVRLPSFDLGPFLSDPARRPVDSSEPASEAPLGRPARAKGPPR